MAYGLKHYIDFPDTVDTSYRVCLLYRDYTGEPTPQRAAPKPFIQDNQVDSIYKPIWGTVFEINAITQLQPAIGLSGFKLEDLFLTDEQECLMEFRKNPDTDNTLLFKGWMAAPKSSAPLQGGDWPLTLVAGCGLGQLKNEEFKPDSGVTPLYFGKMSYLEIITKCLAKTRLELPFSISSSWKAKTDGDYVWAFDLEVDVEVYLDESGEPYDCAKVLTDVLEKFNCIIFQEDARYYILNVEERANTTQILKNYTYLGAYVNTTTTAAPRKNITYNGPLNLSAASYSALPPKKEFGATVNFKNANRSVLKNGWFADRYYINFFGGPVLVMRDWQYTVNWALLTLKDRGIELGPAIALPATDAIKPFWMGDNELKTIQQIIPLPDAVGRLAKMRATIKYVSYTASERYPICVYSIKLKNTAGEFCYLKQDGTWTTERTFETYIQTKDILTDSIYNGMPIVAHTNDIEVQQGYELISSPSGPLANEIHFVLYRPSVFTVGSGQKVLILDTKLEVFEDNKAITFKPKVVNPNVASSHEKESFTLLTGTQDSMYSLSQLYMPGSTASPIYWDTDPSDPDMLDDVFDLMLRKRARSNSKNRLQFEGELYDKLGGLKLRDVLLLDYFPGGTRLYLQTRRRYDFRMRKVESLTIEELIY